MIIKTSFNLIIISLWLCYSCTTGKATNDDLILERIAVWNQMTYGSYVKQLKIDTISSEPNSLIKHNDFSEMIDNDYYPVGYNIHACLWQKLNRRLLWMQTFTSSVSENSSSTLKIREFYSTAVNDEIYVELENEYYLIKSTKQFEFSLEKINSLPEFVFDRSMSGKSAKSNAFWIYSEIRILDNLKADFTDSIFVDYTTFGREE